MWKTTKRGPPRGAVLNNVITRLNCCLLDGREVSGVYNAVEVYVSRFFFNICESDSGGHCLLDLCDVFYIGGTKVGALCGEAVVFPTGAPNHFFTTVKQHGALLAKGRLLGVQFDTLFTDGLYAKISANAIEKSRELIDILKEKGIPFFLESPTNQQFVILDNEQMNDLATQVGFDIWEPFDDHRTVVRFATSWATTSRQLEQLKALL